MGGEGQGEGTGMGRGWGGEGEEEGDVMYVCMYVIIGWMDGWMDTVRERGKLIVDLFLNSVAYLLVDTANEQVCVHILRNTYILCTM